MTNLLSFTNNLWNNEVQVYMHLQFDQNLIDYWPHFFNAGRRKIKLYSN